MCLWVSGCAWMRVCVYVCAAFSCSVWYRSNCGESEETIVLLPCSCCCVVLLSECAVILGPNVCVCVCVPVYQVNGVYVCVHVCMGLNVCVYMSVYVCIRG